MSATPALARRPGGTALAGFANQLRRESGSWWSTRRWWVHALTWTVVVNGLLAVTLWVLPELGVVPEASATTPAETAAQFGGMAVVLGSVAAVVAGQGILIDERRTGVLEWMLSKPLSRSALVAAKFVGHCAALLVTVVLVPWVGVWAQLSLAQGSPWPVGRTLGAALLVGLLVAFNLAFVLVLSATTWSRALVVALPLAGIFGTDLVIAGLPDLVDVLPWNVGRLAGAVLAGGALPSTGPVVSAALLTAVFLAGAAWGLHRTEL